MIVVLLVTFLTHTIINAAPVEEEIKSLPGLSEQLNFKQYSGYLNASEGKFLHYWFVQSERSPENDPLLLWMNGGPGCSSLFGLLGEHGPVHVNKDGQTLYMNPYRWNQIANVVYMEAPCGVGFSYSLSGNYTTNDDVVSNDNYLALRSFFAKFPEYRKNDFYVTGESYGGIYVPTLSVRVLNGPEPINFKGFVVGNGVSDYTLNGNSLVFFAYYHGLFGEDTWDKLVKYCCAGVPTKDSCQFAQSTDLTCQKLVSDATSFVSSGELDRYNLYTDCTVPSSQRKPVDNTRRAVDSGIISESLGQTKTLVRRKIYKNCVDDSYIPKWLNQPSVRTALHIPDGVHTWVECSPEVGDNYITLYHTVKPFYEELLSSGKLRALLYNGDVDMACNFLGDQWFIESLNLPVLSDYQEWHFNKQVAGYFKRFQNLSMVTVKGSGHMVPQDKPGPGFKIIDEFLKGNL